MPNRAAITLTDGAAASHTYEPQGLVGNRDLFIEPGATPLANKELYVRNQNPAKGQEVTKGFVDTMIPVVVTVDGVSSVDRSINIHTTVLATTRHSEAEILDALALHCSALQESTLVEPVIAGRKSLY